MRTRHVIHIVGLLSLLLVVACPSRDVGDQRVHEWDWSWFGVGSGSGSAYVPHRYGGPGLAITLGNTLSGTGAFTSPLGFAPCSVSGQVYQWNGSAWVCAASGGLSGLTTNQMVKATSSTTIGNAWPSDDNTTWGVASKFTITESSGAFRSFSTGQIDGNLTLGGSASLNTTSGSTTITGHATGGGDLLVADSSTGQTAGFNGAYVNLFGSSNTTAGAITNTAVVGANTMTRSAGANNLTNVGIYGNASGAQINVALRTDNGDVQLNNLSGSTNINGATTVNSHLIVASDPTKHIDAITATNTPTATTVNFFGAEITAQGTADATSSAIQSFGAIVSSTTSRSAGANQVQNIALRANASGGQYSGGIEANATGTGTNIGFSATATGGSSNTALRTDNGDVQLNNLSGTTLVTGHGTSAGDLQVADATTAVAGDVKALFSTKAGSLDATAASRNGYAIYASSTATRSAGANTVTNYGLYATASGGQSNIAIYADAGDTYFNQTSGTANFGGDVAVAVTHTLFVDTIQAWVNSDLYLQRGSGTSTVHIGNGTADALTWNGTTTVLPSATTINNTATINGLTTATGGITSTAADSTFGRLNGTRITASLTASVNDWSPSGIGTATIVEITSTTNTWNITGISSSGSAVGRLLLLVNNGGNFITVAHNSASSAAANRISTQAAASRTLYAGSGYPAAMLLMWNGTNWLEVSESSWFVPSWHVGTGGFAVDGGGASIVGASTFSGGSLTLNGTSLIAGAGSTTFHITDKDGTARPTLSTCGTSPSIVGNDASGVVTTGTGATACTITFNTAYGSNVGCVLKAQGATDPTSITVATTTLTINGAAASTKYFYECRDH